jgi:hypothetical protein
MRHIGGLNLARYGEHGRLAVHAGRGARLPASVLSLPEDVADHAGDRRARAVHEVITAPNVLRQQAQHFALQ